MELRGYDVCLPVDQLIDRARVSFLEIRNEMRSLAPIVARELRLGADDPLGVLRELRRRQIPAGRVLEVYAERLAELRELVVRVGFVTAPDREICIRLAGPGEDSLFPGPTCVCLAFSTQATARRSTSFSRPTSDAQTVDHPRVAGAG